MDIVVPTLLCIFCHLSQLSSKMAMCGDNITLHTYCIIALNPLQNTDPPPPVLIHFVQPFKPWIEQKSMDTQRPFFSMTAMLNINSIKYYLMPVMVDVKEENHILASLGQLRIVGANQNSHSRLKDFLPKTPISKRNLCF